MFEYDEKDYMMRRIQQLGQLIARLLRSDKVKYELPAKAPCTQADLLYQELCLLLSYGRINEAENRLYEA